MTLRESDVRLSSIPACRRTGRSEHWRLSNSYREQALFAAHWFRAACSYANIPDLMRREHFALCGLPAIITWASPKSACASHGGCASATNISHWRSPSAARFRTAAQTAGAPREGTVRRWLNFTPASRRFRGVFFDDVRRRLPVVVNCPSDFYCNLSEIHLLGPGTPPDAISEFSAPRVWPSPFRLVRFCRFEVANN